jgi:hypothetical protein
MRMHAGDLDAGALNDDRRRTRHTPRSVFEGVRAVVAAVAVVGGATGHAGVIGSWDFGAGSLAAAVVVPGATLTRLPDTPYYVPFGGTPNPPALAFNTTAAFGIAPLGGYTGQVMRVPDMSGRGAAAGLMASFAPLTNGTQPGGGAATKLNRYSIVMDVLVPSSSFGGAKDYIALYQPRANNDASWFVREPSRNMGSTVAYSAVNSFQPDTWYRIAQVMSLDAATSAPRCEYFLNGSRVGAIVPDQIVLDSDRNVALKDQDLVPDGAWSIGLLSESNSALPSALSGFFVFNDQTNEYGELYVANLQFRDDALGVDALATLGGPGGGVIPVPEPGGLHGLLAFAAAWLAAASCQPHKIHRPRLAPGCPGDLPRFTDQRQEGL